MGSGQEEEGSSLPPGQSLGFQGPCGVLTGQVLQQLDVILWNQPPLAIQSPL